MKLYKSLRFRIFLSMLLLLVLTFVALSVLTGIQYKEEAEDYHRERLLRKEANIKENINYVLKNTTYPVETDMIPLIFKTKIYEIKDIHNLEIHLYDFEGNLLKSSRASFLKDTSYAKLSTRILKYLEDSPTKSYIYSFEEDGQQYQSSFSYLTDASFKPLAILNLPYIEDDGFMTKELRENLKRASIVYGFMLFIAIGLAYILSKYITRSLQTVTEKITETRLNKRNKKISLQTNTSQEIETLVEAYNGMIDELEVSAAQLASNEREAAWREMAKQVAHEIKNPLTPMRLSVQSFQRKFDPEDPNISEKVQEFSNTLIQQIDTLSSIASAFSTYAKMPAQQDETLDVVTITKLALDIFNEEYIYFFSDEKEIISTFDRTQWIRVITNLVKNSIQAIEKKDPESPRVEVRVFTENQKIFVTVSDNGSGIAEEHKSKVFEPKFTTKSSGMGLGLAMVKNIVETYGGTISLQSVERKGTTFTVCIPLDD
ncbi:MAG TPA: ATP-binding protein [Flavobacteriaceae bacterium]|nr:GHKL domain-containing protein [Flavobacteriaceae bacterium]MCB9212084.1 GHKL domain-containing protein [Alteromonas sp.]HPF09820.1 ATP-binding protein [Flavobacteriaceae bacterium]HQU22024.1 ATP-binding protein [Flavobacteriaceae bacterium]HQU64095.1 ATP-binding protein [Flavobacteriaceae bacterium]